MSASDEVINGWRECADPVELAAAVAAGVEVQCVAVDGRTWETGCDDSESFRRCMANDCRYRVPAGWSPDVPPADDGPVCGMDPCEECGRSPGPPADDLRERIAPPNPEGWPLATTWAQCAEHRRLGGHVEQFSEGCWYDRGDSADQLAQSSGFPGQGGTYPRRLVPLAPPVPPWPGAVLSGLVDEDGEPTWLAQAGQVRGEQVRCSRNLSWIEDSRRYGDGLWVEVRAPRAPETERVQAWEAVRDGRQVVGASSPFEAHYIWRSGPNRAFIGERTMDKAVLVAPDGTVEVLKDGDR